MAAALYANLAAIALGVIGWDALDHRVGHMPRRVRALLFGLLMGSVAITVMSLSIPFEGMLFDLRLVAVALASWFGGPLAGVTALVLACVFRLALGGPGAMLGVLAVAAVTGLGVAIHFGTKGSKSRYVGPVAIGFATADIFLLSILLAPAPGAAAILTGPGWPIALLSFAAATLAGLQLLQAQRLSSERHLLQAALRNSPDYVSVKDDELRFVSVNTNVAAHFGFEDPTSLRGKSDRDVDDAAHAEELTRDETAILSGEKGSIEKEERLPTSAGNRWFVTAKLPVRNFDGEIIGIVGITRDVTDQKLLQAQLSESRDRLSAILKEMSDGVALFRSDGTLVFCNDQYCHLFPRTAAIRVPGQNLRDILRQSAVSGEQVGVTDDMLDEWVESVVASLAIEDEQVVELYDGRWLRLRTRPLAAGESLVHVTDITSDKLMQKTLVNLAEQLKQIAKTDALTGLPNRRAFDTKLDEEVRRSSRSRAPLSLLMIDVDRFKLYNDTYGHQQGDRCLKALAKCITEATRRPGDVAARYGGEEFAIILPDTDEDGAFHIAQRLRELLGTAGLVHASSPGGIVSVSIGAATYTTQDEQRSPAELIDRADQALYLAKGAGRDRVMGWRPRYAVSGKRIL